MKYEPVIGIEVHVELSTASKAFCGCSTQYGAEPNTQVCPVCLGLPGTLPVVNRRAVEMAIKAALALNCEISRFTKFDRKNYFYPDLTKGYQISQYDQPIGRNGFLTIQVGGEEKRIRIRRLHLEEDTGKSLHEGDGTLLDYNRAGVPLIEIVSEPDIRSGEEARAYLEELQRILRYIEVSDVRIEEGSMRCEANISLRRAGSDELGVLHEIKNIGSFRGVERAIAYEIKAQTQALEAGESIKRATLRWDEEQNRTVFMRSKETAEDYRYFPEPDIPPIEVDDGWIECIRAEIPELPASRYRRYVSEYGLPEQDAGEIVNDRHFSDFYDQVVSAYGGDPKNAANWMLGELRRRLNFTGQTIGEIAVKPQQLAELLTLIDKGTISSKIAKDVFTEMFESGRDPDVIVKEKGLVQITDESAIEQFVDQVLAENPQSVQDILNGKDRAIGFLVGQVMKLSRGKANPQLANQLIREKISKLEE